MRIWVSVSIILQWARQNLRPCFVDFTTAAPRTTKPAPKPWSPRPCESTDTLTSVEIDVVTKTSQFGTFFIFTLLKTPHGYITMLKYFSGSSKNQWGGISQQQNNIQHESNNYCVWIWRRAILMVKSIWLIYEEAYCRGLVCCRTGKIVLGNVRSRAFAVWPKS